MRKLRVPHHNLTGRDPQRRNMESHHLGGGLTGKAAFLAAALTGTTDVSSVAGAAHGPSMERTRRPFSQLMLRAGHGLTGPEGRGSYVYT